MLIILKHIWRVILIILAIATLVFMILGIRPINTCSICGKYYFGKEEAINDKPACETCHEIWYVEHSKCLETKWEDRKMKSLDEFNEERRKLYSIGDDPIPNGIACPKCGAELLDSRPNVSLTSYPPQKNIHCSKCDYRGYRIE